MAILLLFFFPFFIQTSHTLQQCQESCTKHSGPQVRFPFGLTGDTTNHCSRYPGFNLSCNSHRQTILTLPKSGHFIVQYINYRTQEIHIRDPANCLARRFIKNFDLSGSPFISEFYIFFSFLNCSSNFTAYSGSLPASSREVACLSDDNYTVFAFPATYDGSVPSIPSCTVMDRMIDVPISWRQWSDEDTVLSWSAPNCRGCEERGGTCGFKDDTSLDLGCYNLPTNKHGLTRGAKYGIIIGVGIPAFLCVIGIGCYLCGLIRTYRGSYHSSTELPIPFAHPPSTMAARGLDGPSIELYPKTLLGESRRLPKPNDSTCPICLCEYEPKETLRTIPECNHYFHVHCIDEWLKMNATCPVCRNSPDIASPFSSSSSSIATPLSSSSLSALSSSLSS